MNTVFPYQGTIDFDAYLDQYLQQEDAIRKIPSEAELKELARKGVVKDQLVLAPLPEDEPAMQGDTLTLHTVSELPKFNKERVTVSIGRGLYDKGLEAALVGKKSGESCTVTVKDKPVTATILEIKRKTAPEPTDEMVEAMHTRAEGTIRSTPSTRPRPARRMGTTANFFPFSVGALVLQMGVSTSFSVRGRSRVAS